MRSSPPPPWSMTWHCSRATSGTSERVERTQDGERPVRHAMTEATGAVFLGPGRPLSIEPFLLDPPGPGEVLVRMVASGCLPLRPPRRGRRLGPTDGRDPGPRGRRHRGGGRVRAWHRPRSGTWSCWSGPRPAARVGRAGAPNRGCAPRPGAAGIGGMPTRSGRIVPTDRRWACTAASARMRRHQVVDAAAAIAVDPRTPHDVAALLGCAATTGIGAVRNTAAVRAGESVVVIGLGGVGLSAVMAAADAGAGHGHRHRHPARQARAGDRRSVRPTPSRRPTTRASAPRCCGSPVTARIT